MAIRFPLSARVTSTPHRDRCGREATRDAIFLLQRRKINLLSTEIDGLGDNDCETMVVTDRNELPDWVEPFVIDGEGDPYVCINAEFVSACVDQSNHDDLPLAVDWWETESVWLDRDEAERWAEAKSHRFPHGWRVYAVCAEGELARLLKTQDGESWVSD